MPLIELNDVSKVYRAPKTESGEVRALDHLSLSVNEGTVKGLLGPNGAGKTTVVKILTTLIKPTHGTATIDGLDVVSNSQKIRSIIGTSGQYATVDEKLTARENLVLIGRLFRMGDKKAKARADELLELFTLTPAADRPLDGFSGGMRRRLDLAASLVNNPRVLILDEPTTGLDPAARNSLWEVIRDRVAGGTTLLLTTQYLEEADQLAHDISVIDHGRVIAKGTADQLKTQVGGQLVRVTVVDESHVPTVEKILADEAHVGNPAVSERTVTVGVNDGQQALQRVLTVLNDQGIAIHDVGLQRPTLDDVFLSLTGGKAGDGR